MNEHVSPMTNTNRTEDISNKNSERYLCFSRYLSFRSVRRRTT